MKLEWNFKNLEVDESKTLNEIKKLTNNIYKYKEKITKPIDLKKIILAKEKIKYLFSYLYVNQSLKQSKNTQDKDALAKLSKYSLISSEISSKTRYVNLWFANLDNKKAAEFINSSELKEYKYYLKKIRESKKYMLDEKSEEIISLKNITGGSKSSDIFEILCSSYEYDFLGKKVNSEVLTSNFKSSNPKHRETAYKTLLSNFKDKIVVHSELYKNVVLDWYNEGIKIRGYKSPISMRNHGNDVTDKAVNALLNVCKKNAKVFSEYFKLKHEVNGKKYENNRYHVYAPLNVKDVKYDFKKSKKLALEVFKEFDLRMYDAAKKVFEAEHVDSHPKKHKRGGAFCYTPNSKMTPFVMLNHTDTLNDLFTLVHELGHAIHGVASSINTEFNHHANIPLCETASVFSENLLAEKLLKESKSKEEKISILSHMIDGEYATIARQSFFVLFEIEAHKAISEGRTSTDLENIYYDLLKMQFKGIDIPEEFKYEWSYIPHIYNTPFYCYGYAWGNLLVLSLWNMYKKQGESFKEKYWKLLEAGDSENPQKLLKKLGINVEKEEFWEEGFKVIKKQIKELKLLIKS